MGSSNEVGRSVEEEHPFYLEKYVRPGIAARAAALLGRNKSVSMVQLDKNGTKSREDGPGKLIHIEDQVTKSQQQPITPTTIPTPPTPPNTTNRGRSASIPSGGDPSWSRSPETNALRDFRRVVSSQMKMCTVAKWVRNVPLSNSVERSPNSTHRIDGWYFRHESGLSAGSSFGHYSSPRRSLGRQQVRESRICWTENEHSHISCGDGDCIFSFDLERSQVFEQTEDDSSPGDRQLFIRCGDSIPSRGDQPSFSKARSNGSKVGLQKTPKSLDAGCPTSGSKHPVAS